MAGVEGKQDQDARSRARSSGSGQAILIFFNSRSTLMPEEFESVCLIAGLVRVQASNWR